MSRSGTMLRRLARAKRARACLSDRSSALKLKRCAVTAGGISATSDWAMAGAAQSAASVKASNGRRRENSDFTAGEQWSRWKRLVGRGQQDFLSHGDEVAAMCVQHPDAGRIDGFQRELSQRFTGAADAAVEHGEGGAALNPHSR